MNFINARPAEGMIRLSYQRDGLPASEPFEMDFRRIAIGLSYPEHASTSRTSYGYAVVIGERVFYGDDEDSEPTRMYVALCETDANEQSALYGNLVGLKDSYLATTVYCPDRPAPQVEALQQFEGLCHYADEAPVFLKHRWSTYVSRDTTAVLHKQDIPTAEAQAAEIQRMLSTEVLHPESLWPMMGRSGKPVFKLTLPANMPTEKVRTAVPLPSAFPQVIQALYMVLHGLETTGRWMGRQGQSHEHQGSSVTGY